jgi:hypothetical protein
MSELALLAQEVGTGERTSRRAVSEGTLRARRPSPRKLELSLSERDYLRRRWPPESIGCLHPEGAAAEFRKAELKRAKREIIACLADFPRQYAALERAMASFGGDFDLRQFKAAFETTDDLDAYNRVQAVERGLGRVQNFVADDSARDFIARYRGWIAVSVARVLR